MGLLRPEARRSELAPEVRRIAVGEMLDIVRRYLDHLADHATQDALGCLAPDFELEFAGGGFKMSKDQAATALEWDAGANGRLDWRVVDESWPTVTIQGSEGNDFLDLVGIGPIAFRSAFTISPSGLIAHQLHETSWGAVSLSDAMAPLIAWASEHDPEELAEIYPEGRLSYSGPMAVRWVRLAGKWKAATTAKGP
jgi:hypothetical protein